MKIVLLHRTPRGVERIFIIQPKSREQGWADWEKAFESRKRIGWVAGAIYPDPCPNGQWLDYFGGPQYAGHEAFSKDGKGALLIG